MGYRIEFKAARFHINANQKAQALKTLKRLRPTSGGGWSNGRKEWSWVSQDQVTKAETLEAALEEWRFPVKADAEGNIISIYFDGEKLGDEDQLFKELAPFVKSGSFIEMGGEDGDRWRWTFTNGTFKTVHSEITWPEDDEDEDDEDEDDEDE